MAYRGQGQKVQKRSRIQVWLYEQVNMRIEGCIIGFDEYMNLVLDDAEEIHSKTKSRKQLDFICQRERERTSRRSGKQKEKRQAEGEAGSPLSKEPNVGLDPRTLGS
ncbi:small nuclear ribonucleoprotein E isoform X2 [Callorhinus ursinus]|uniref:small nuclear ribonucleoprotein E isoform X2 n=1 Tax=Callorhinus ursinus TaxID=34884 RepID=UPI003CD03155